MSNARARRLSIMVRVRTELRWCATCARCLLSQPPAPCSGLLEPAGAGVVFWLMINARNVLCAGLVIVVFCLRVGVAFYCSRWAVRLLRRQNLADRVKKRMRTRWFKFFRRNSKDETNDQGSRQSSLSRGPQLYLLLVCTVLDLELIQASMPLFHAARPSLSS